MHNNTSNPSLFLNCLSYSIIPNRDHLSYSTESNRNALLSKHFLRFLLTSLIRHIDIIDFTWHQYFYENIKELIVSVVTFIHLLMSILSSDIFFIFLITVFTQISFGMQLHLIILQHIFHLSISLPTLYLLVDSTSNFDSAVHLFMDLFINYFKLLSLHQRLHHNFQILLYSCLLSSALYHLVSLLYTTFLYLKNIFHTRNETTVRRGDIEVAVIR